MGAKLCGGQYSFLRDNLQFWQKRYNKSIPPQLEESCRQIEAFHAWCFCAPVDGEQHVGLKNNNKGYVYKINESFYYGDILGSKPSGNGVIYYKNNTFYQGQFRHGSRHGKGKLVQNSNINLKLKNGEWVDDQFSSGDIFHQQQSKIQKIILIDPIKYRIKFENNQIFEGEMKEKQKGKLVKDGEGTLTIGNSYKYVGRFKDDNKDGEGCVEEYFGVRKYQGSFKQNYRTKGKMTYTLKNKQDKTAILEKQGEWFDRQKYFTGRVKFVSGRQFYYERNEKKGRYVE